MASGQQRNELAPVSLKVFDVQETERYAGSRGDPARMASNFAGVQGGDDSRNDIIIRGNTPQGLVWRLEDMTIPNPNHFAVPGTTGGPVSILNNKSRGRSEFFTGAFPASYGNGIAGAFDLSMRNGNNHRYEATAQLGILGTELAAEGPIGRKTGASFLVTYRYSTLKLFEGLHIKIGTNSVPNYQDASFKLFFPIGKKGSLSIFGIGGLSKIDLIVSTLTEPSQELYGPADRDQYFHSNTGITGLSYNHRLSNKTYAKIVAGYTHTDAGGQHDKVFRDASFAVDSIRRILDYRFRTGTLVTHAYVQHKFNARHVLKAGILYQLFLMQFTDSSRQFPPTRPDWQQRENFKGNTSLTEAYIQYLYRVSDRLHITTGMHAQYLLLNGSAAIEPRAGLRWVAGSRDVFGLGYGLHSQMQPLYQYYAHLPQYTADQWHNADLGFTKSHHLSAAYDHSFNTGIKLHTEVYYQYLFQVPVGLAAASSYSSINQGNSFDRNFPDTLKNTGNGHNYGWELSLEKSFSHGYYLMMTGSLYQSQARGNDGVWRNSDYNGRYALNLLGGYERKTRSNHTLILGAKITIAGGRLYSPADIPASEARGELVIIDSLRNTLRFPAYFRADLKLGYRINAGKLTHELGLDLVNITGHKNLLSLTYNADLAQQGNPYPFSKQYQLGFLPLFYYRVDIGWK